jgi:DNA-binding response OmpR family regulator
MNIMQASVPGENRHELAYDRLAQWRSVCKPSVGRRVLVVGCERSLVRYFCRFLDICGYSKVDSASSAAEAFDKALANRPDVLIVMILMPGISGVDIGVHISKQSNCGVLFVTAQNIEDQQFKDYLEALRAKGCVCMALPLPFENMDLLTKLKLLAWH